MSPLVPAVQDEAHGVLLTPARHEYEMDMAKAELVAVTVARENETRARVASQLFRGYFQTES